MTCKAGYGRLRLLTLTIIINYAEQEMRRMKEAFWPDFLAENRESDEAEQRILAAMMRSIKKEGAAADYDNARQARHEPFDGHGRTYIKALVDEELLERGGRRVNGDLPEFRDADQWRAWIIAKLAAIHNLI